MMERDAGLVRAGEARFAAYLDAITAVLGHASRVAPARAYCTGLLLPGERKSVEPMAARIEPDRVQAAHQSLHHVVAKAEWDDDAVLGAVRGQVLPVLERHGSALVSTLPRCPCCLNVQRHSRTENVTQ